MACSPARRHRIPERLSRCVTSVLQAASTTPEPLMELAFHALEVFPDEGAGAKCIDVLAQSFKRIHCSCVGVGVGVGVGTDRRDMKY